LNHGRTATGILNANRPKDIDERVGAFLDRPLSGEWPYLWLDATYLKQREGGRIVSVAAIIAVAVNTEGKREVVGLHIGPSEAEAFWSTEPPSWVRRGWIRVSRGGAHGDPRHAGPCLGRGAVAQA
jgi:transposase-like protein